MFAVALATWCNLTGDPVQTHYQGILPLADATLYFIVTGKLSGTSFSKGGAWVETVRTLVFCLV